MPYSLLKMKDGCYMVVSRDSGKIKAKCSTLQNAKAQIRLLMDYEKKKGGAIPPEIMAKAREKYYLAKAMKEIEREIPETDKPQLLPEYEKIPELKKSKKVKKPLIGKKKRKITKRIILGKSVPKKEDYLEMTEEEKEEESIREAEQRLQVFFDRIGELSSIMAENDIPLPQDIIDYWEEEKTADEHDIRIIQNHIRRMERLIRQHTARMLRERGSGMKKKGGRVQEGANAVAHEPLWVALYNMQLELDDFRDSIDDRVSRYFERLTTGNGEYRNFINELRSVWTGTPMATRQNLINEGVNLILRIRNRFPNLPPYQDVNAQNIPPMPQQPPAVVIPDEEGGYLESFKRKPGLLPPAVRKMLDKIGDETITSLQVVRTPLNKFTTTLLNVVSLGAYNKAVKESPYDSMFHLAMRINGKYTTDKQEVIKLNTTNPIKKNSETMDVPVSKTIKIRDLLENGRKKMGDDKFTNYDARTNNCQDFLLGLLDGSGLGNSQVRGFIKQDPDVVFKKIPAISEKISRFLTDVGAVAERVMEGEGTKTKMGWKQFLSTHTKGKKFQNREEVNAFVRELSKKYKNQ